MRKIKIVAEVSERKFKELFKNIIEDKFEELNYKLNGIIERMEQIEENLRAFNLKLKRGKDE